MESSNFIPVKPEDCVKIPTELLLTRFFELKGWNFKKQRTQTGLDISLTLDGDQEKEVRELLDTIESNYRFDEGTRLMTVSISEDQLMEENPENASSNTNIRLIQNNVSKLADFDIAPGC